MNASATSLLFDCATGSLGRFQVTYHGSPEKLLDDASDRVLVVAHR
jgi:hypothetical protein